MKDALLAKSVYEKSSEVNDITVKSYNNINYYYPEQGLRDAYNFFN